MDDASQEDATGRTDQNQRAPDLASAGGTNQSAVAARIITAPENATGQPQQ